MIPTNNATARTAIVVLEMSQSLLRKITKLAARSGVSVDEWISQNLREHVEAVKLAPARRRRCASRLTRLRAAQRRAQGLRQRAQDRASVAAARKPLATR